jgi:hypothetical protein
VVEEYEAYLQRFDSAVGEAELGAFVKHGGRLVKKLRLDEFETLHAEYAELAQAYTASLSRGDTINDVVVRMFRKRAADLLPGPGD